jgi:hypothetical protein
MAMNKFSKSSAALLHYAYENPPIPFVSKLKNSDKVDGSDTDKYEWIKLDFFMESVNRASNVLPTVCYIQGWIPRRLDQVGGGLP